MQFDDDESGTHLDSPKAQAIARDARVALTFWWDHIGKPVRVTGSAHRVSDAVADAMFSERSREGQIIATLSAQSAPLRDARALEDRFKATLAELRDKSMPRPPRWGGFCVEPMRMEFLTFAPSRLHERVLYVREGADWRSEWLPP